MRMSRIDRLTAAGIDVAGLPEGQRRVLAQLSDEEFEVLVAVRVRLDSTEDSHADVEAHRVGDSGGLYW
jgi:hypothetical protein